MVRVPWVHRLRKNRTRKVRNSFPGFSGALINGSEFDVEMTSVPDMTGLGPLKGHFASLRSEISEIAEQPGQTRGEVISEFLRKCSDKRHRAESTEN